MGHVKRQQENAKAAWDYIARKKGFVCECTGEFITYDDRHSFRRSGCCAGCEAQA